MPYVIIKRNGKRVRDPFLYLDRDVDNLSRNDVENCYTLQNVVTRRIKKIGKCKRRGR